MKTRSQNPFTTLSLARLAKHSLVSVFLAACLLHTTGLVSWAEKGGNGKPGGDTDPSLPPLVEPFVQYRVTWFKLDEEIGDFPHLWDINRDGFAVGEYNTPEGLRRGYWANSEGNSGNLDDLFVDEMADYFPGWRFDRGSHINAAGKIAGRLVPLDQPRSVPHALLVVGDLSTDPPSITVVNESIDDDGAGIHDLNEAGDLLIRIGEEPEYWIHRAPYLTDPERILFDLEEPVPAYWRPACLNDAGQVLINATYVVPVQINRKKNEERNIAYAYRRETTGAFTPLGPSFAGNRLGNRLAEDGSVHSANYTANLSAEFIPKCWTMEQGWSAISPLRGWIPIVSKAKTVAEPEPERTEVAIRGWELDHVVYREGWGPYRIEVVQGQTDGDFELWHQTDATPLMGISRPNSATNAGFICGWDAFIQDRGNRVQAGFILTPILDF